jgi:hypothetical protein
MNFSAHPVAVRAGFVTSDVSVGLAGEAAAEGAASCGAFETEGEVVAAGGGVADAGGAAAWARSSTSSRCDRLGEAEFPTASATEAAWQNTKSPIEAVIVQQNFLMPASLN